MKISPDDYPRLVKSLEDLCLACEKIARLDTGRIYDLTLGYLQETIGEARKLASYQDQFLSSGLYHIIGSDGLSASQLTKIIYLTKRLGKTRTSVKRFAGIDNAIYSFSLAENKNNSKY